MSFSITLIFNSILLGIGLAMDAFSVSLANGLNEPCMRKNRMISIAFIFGMFQALMPLIGWVCVHTVVQYFHAFEALIPWIALILLGFIGGKMLKEGIESRNEEFVCKIEGLSVGTLMLQGIATSIDALSVGFAIAHYNLVSAILSALIIGIVTFGICMGGLAIGKKAGTKLTWKAGILGGVILIFIGLEIFITSWF